jgi:hypothetical protein
MPKEMNGRQFYLDNYRYVLPDWTHDYARGVFKRRTGASTSDIFRDFVTRELLFKIWSEAGVAHWSYTSGSKECTINGGKFSERIVYIYLAVFIFITAQQDAPKENTFNKFIDLRGLLKDL